MLPPQSVAVEFENSGTGRRRAGTVAGGLRRGRPSVDRAQRLDACEARKLRELYTPARRRRTRVLATSASTCSSSTRRP
eukprot:14114126-Heterocapsa_arctica.AAC.1